jgi:hypothetical protein
MAISYITDINLNKNELQNAVIQNLSTPPSSPAEGQIYYDNTAADKQLYFFDGTSWIPVSGDIKRVQITADDGNAYNVTSGNFLMTISGDTGISTTLSGSQLEIDLDDTAVTPGTYGSSTSIPNFTVDQQGRITNAGNNSITVGNATITYEAGDGLAYNNSNSTDGAFTTNQSTNETFTLDVDNTVVRTSGAQSIAGVKTFNDNVVINADLTVSGSTTTKVSETVLIEDNIITLNSNETGTPTEDSGIEVERGTATNVQLRWSESNDYWELTEDGTNYYKIRTSNDTDGFATTIAGAADTSYTVTHNLGTKDVIVQIYDINGTDATVYADVVRTSTSQITVSIGSVPATNDLRVLVSKIG